jgi:hypothetical protein
VAPRSWDVIPFLQVDRPILFMAFEGQLARWENADLETWGRKTGTLVHEPAALPAAIDRALADPREQSDIRRAACADIYFNVGRATDAGMRELHALLGLEAARPAAAGA